MLNRAKQSRDHPKTSAVSDIAALPHNRRPRLSNVLGWPCPLAPLEIPQLLLPHVPIPLPVVRRRRLSQLVQALLAPRRAPGTPAVVSPWSAAALSSWDVRVRIHATAGPVVSVQGEVATASAAVVEDDDYEEDDEDDDEGEYHVGVGTVEQGPASLTVVVVFSHVRFVQAGMRCSVFDLSRVSGLGKARRLLPLAAGSARTESLGSSRVRRQAQHNDGLGM